MATTTQTDSKQANSDAITPEDLDEAPRFIRDLVRFTGKREDAQIVFDDLREEYSLAYAVRTRGDIVMREEHYNARMEARPVCREGARLRGLPRRSQPDRSASVPRAFSHRERTDETGPHRIEARWAP
jgi:hypothetical protein